MNEITIRTLGDAITQYKKTPGRLLVADRSEAFDRLNYYADGVVGHNHIFSRLGYAVYLIYYMLSDDAKFTILEIREVD